MNILLKFSKPLDNKCCCTFLYAYSVSGFAFSISWYENIELGDKISLRKIKKILYFQDILNSCDIGLSTVMIDLKFLKKNNFKFPNIKTKEDYVLWLRILKKIPHIEGINKKLTNYRKRKNSLSSNTITSIINGFKVYKYYLKMGYFESLYRLIILSFNYLKKKFVYDIFN